MRNARLWLASSLASVVFLGSGCRTAPIVEVCLLGEAGCVCSDPRLPAGAQDYVLTFEECRNYIARSPESEEILRRWALENCRSR